jgi:hypothetical protein
MFRNNVGKAWIGKSVTLKGGSVLAANGSKMPVPPGSVLVLNPRFFQAGLFKGSSDLIGWRTIDVTPEMVGRKLAVFTAAEIKTPKGRESPEQKTFRAAVAFGGGLSFVLRDEEELIAKHQRAFDFDGDERSSKA